MIDQNQLIEELQKGKTPVLINTSLKECISIYLKLVNTDQEMAEVFLISLENYFDQEPVSNEVKGFDDFFNLSFLFDRDKNFVNRFFDAVLGIRKLGKLIKTEQVVEDKIGTSQTKIRVSGSFDYSHTQTHYSHLIDIFNYLSPKRNELIVDIGSGFGRVGAFIGLCFPEVQYIGYEIINERVVCSKKMATRNSFDNLSFNCQNVLGSNFNLPHADIYYFYDPLDQAELIKLVNDLKNHYQLDNAHFKIVALGGYDDEILSIFKNQNWLTPIRNLNDDYFKHSGLILETITV